MPRDHGDAIIDQLLREELGGDRPRDLTSRVMGLARAFDRRRRGWWLGGGLAAAAAIALGVTLFVLWPRPYPAPDASGAFVVEGGGALQRGARIETTGQAQLTIGGYVNATLEEKTTLTLGGDKFKEKLLVDEGAVACKVEKKRGEFDVQVGPASVHVTGTSFTVKVAAGVRENVAGRWMSVAVQEGSVVVDGVPSRKPMTLKQGKGEKFFIPTEVRHVDVRRAEPVKPVPATRRVESRPAPKPASAPPTSAPRATTGAAAATAPSTRPREVELPREVDHVWIR